MSGRQCNYYFYQHRIGGRIMAKLTKEQMDRPLSVWMADSLLKRRPDLSDRWSHEYGVVFKGLEEVWLKTREDRYLQYIKRSYEANIDENGEIRGYEMEDFHLDHINSGRLLFRLYSITGEERYQKAAHKLREQFRRHPRTSEGGFWHKKCFPYQMWLDGIYMGLPFYAEYAKTFNEPEIFDDVVKQVTLITAHTRDKETGLHYHAWDEKKEQIWANPETGCSPSFWGRATGWFAMALVDILDYLPESHQGREKIIGVLNDLVKALAEVQDAETGLWYQVLDRGKRPGNYHEASASCMFIYAIAKGVRKGYLPETFLANARKAYAGVIEHLIEVDDDGLLNLKGTCQTAGLGDRPNRDGSFAYYISEPVVVNDLKGIAAFILASTEMESLPS